MLDVKWVKTTAAIYNAIFAAHHANFSVFETCTYHDGSEWGASGTLILTAWGFKGAPCALIKSEGRGDADIVTDWQYFIAIPIETDD